MTSRTRFTYSAAAKTIPDLKALGFVRFVFVRAQRGRITVKAYK